MPHATVPTPPLHALILCGPGSSLSTFTSNPKELPKAVLPIANRPMAWYPLDWCYRMGLTSITLVTAPESLQALESALATNPALTSLPNPKPEVLAPMAVGWESGTAEVVAVALRELQRSGEGFGDFVVLPCDFICEVEGTRLFREWMTLNPLSSIMASDDGQYGSRTTSLSKAGNSKGGLSLFYPVENKKDETDFLATISPPSSSVPAPLGSLRPQIEQIVLNLPTDALNDKISDDKGFFRLRTNLLAKHSRVKMRMRYRDSGVYFLPSWVGEWLKRENGEVAGENAVEEGAGSLFESLSEDLLGWWGKCGWQKGLAEKVGLDEVLNGDPSRPQSGDGTNGDAGVNEEGMNEVDLASLSSTKVSAPITNGSHPRQDSPTFASRVGAITPPPTKKRRAINVPPLLAYIHPKPPQPQSQDSTTPQRKQQGATTQTTLDQQPLLIRRVDTSPSLLTTSLHLAKQQAPTASSAQTDTHIYAHDHKVHPTATLGQQSRVSEADSLIAENVQIGMRANIKESVVGANCEIGRNVRLTKCLLMESVIVGDGAVLSGCVVGRRAKVEGVEIVEGKGKSEGAGAGTKLTDCEVAPGFVVEAGTEAKGEKFMAFEDGDLEDVEGDEDESGVVDDEDGGTFDG